MMVKSKRKNSFFAKFFKENLGLKILAIIVASAIVSLVRLQEDAQRNMDVELVWLEPPLENKLTIVSDFPDTVRLRLQGPRTTIDSLEKNAVPPVQIEMNNFKLGSSTLFFNEDMFDIPSRLHIMRITPASIRIKMERVKTRRIPVKIRFFGKLKKGMEFVKPPESFPGSILVTGPASIVFGTKKLETQSINISEFSVGNHKINIPIILAEKLTTISGSLDVGVNFLIRWIQSEKTFLNLPVRFSDTQVTAKIKPANVSVTLKGPQKVVENIKPSSLVLYVKADKVKLEPSGQVTGEIDVKGLPEGVLVKKITPKTVDLKLGK